MSLRPKPWYFERDCPFCRRSASSFCRNPLNFLAHAMWVKWLYHANFQTFQRSFVVLVSFHGHLAQKYEWMPEKDQMKSERVENCWCGFEWCILNTQRVWSSNKFKIMKSLCNRWVFVPNPDTSKEIVSFVHEVHPVFAVTLSTF